MHAFGGYRVQGKGADAEQRLIEDAAELEGAGAGMIVLEAIPAKLGAQVTKRLRIPTIGIGAGPDCSGQVLVLHDMLGITRGKRPRFVRDFASGAASVEAAIRTYVADVKSRRFPDDAVHGY